MAKRLLKKFPAADFDDRDRTTEWVEALAAEGGVDLAPGKTARWLTRLLTHRQKTHNKKRSAVLLALVGDLADRLREDGVAVDLSGLGSQTPDLDLLDLCAAEDIPLTGTPPRHLQLYDWFRDDRPGARDLLGLVAHPTFRAQFRRACVDLLGSHLFGGQAPQPGPAHPNLLAWAVSVPGVARGLEDGVDELVRRVPDAPLADLAAILYQLAPLFSAAGYARFPGQLDRLGSADLEEVLARTLRGGLLAEYGWPAWEQALEGLNADQIRLDRAWPYLVVHDQRRAVLLDPSGIVAEHTMRVPKTLLPPRCTVHDGRLLVSWTVAATEPGYWVDRPDEVFDVAAAGPDLGGTMVGPSARLPSADGHVVRGGGFETPPEPEQGRIVQLRWRRDLPAGAAGGPLGGRDGRIGWDLVYTPDDGLFLEGVDGRRAAVSGSVVEGTPLVGVLRFPAGSDVLVTTDYFGQPTIWDPATGTPALQPSSSAHAVPIDWWDVMVPCDEAGSRALRALDRAAASSAADLVTHPRLRAAVAAEVRAAAEAEATLSTVRALRTLPAAPAVPVEAHDEALNNGLAGLLEPTHRVVPPRRRLSRPSAAGGYHTLDLIGRIPAAFDGGAARLSGGVTDWTRALSGLGAVALRAAMPTTLASDRAALCAFLDAVAAAGLADGTSGLTVVSAVVDEDSSKTVERFRFGDTVAVRVNGGGSGFGYAALRLVVRGRLESGPEVDVTERTELGGWGDAATVGRFTRLLADLGPAPWRPEAVRLLAEQTGMAFATAAVVLTGMPYVEIDREFTVPKAYRKAIGLSSREERAAREELQAVRPHRRLRLLDAAMPLDPMALWTTGADVERLAAVWTAAEEEQWYFEPWRVTTT